jgi:hexosaminidase
MIKMTFLAAMTLCSVTATTVTADDAPLPLVPQPQKVERDSGRFTLAPNLRIAAEPVSDAATVAEQLAANLKRSTGLDVAIGKTGAIVFTTKGANPALGPEGYTLTVKPDGVTIAATTGAGMFYGMQTFLQLLPPQVFSANKVSDVQWTAPCVRIEDQPRFGWRGLHLDVGRHYMPVEFLKKYIDLLAQHKMNIFHWHLTEDQGWRIEIKKYPKLTEIGAWRSETVIPQNPGENDGKKHGGFYTQDEVREIVEYARQRHITVVPEIEMPGHALAALAAYPELGCTGGPYHVATTWGVFDDVFCVGNDKTLQFCEDVLDEVLELFPSKYIHIGGDECPRTRWAKCLKCQARVKNENLKNTNELQGYLNRRIEKYLAAHGRRLVGWDEILESSIPAGAVVMSWRGEKGGIHAAHEGHDVIMAPNTFTYFDYHQAKQGEPIVIGWFLPLEKVYSYDPVPPQLSSAEAKRILGAQGQLWTEFMKDSARVEYMAYPRACALAEVTWTEKSRKNWDNFRARLETHAQRLSVQVVNFRPLNKPSGPPATVHIAGQTATVSMPWGARQDNTIDRAFDGKDDTYFLNDANLNASDTLVITLPVARTFTSIEALTGNADRPSDIMADGDLLEVSADGNTFKTVAVFKGGIAKAALPATPIKSIRLFVKTGGNRWLVIRELKVQ